MTNGQEPRVGSGRMSNKQNLGQRNGDVLAAQIVAKYQESGYGGEPNERGDSSDLRNDVIRVSEINVISAEPS